MTSAQSSTAVDTTSRLAALRELMAKRNIHVYGIVIKLDMETGLKFLFSGAIRGRSSI